MGILTLWKKPQTDQQRKSPNIFLHLEECTGFPCFSTGFKLKFPLGSSCEVVTLLLCPVAEAVRPGYSVACSEAVWEFRNSYFAFPVWYVVCKRRVGSPAPRAVLSGGQSLRAHVGGEQLLHAVIWRCPWWDEELWLITVSTHLTCLSQMWLP